MTDHIEPTASGSSAGNTDEHHVRPALERLQSGRGTAKAEMWVGGIGFLVVIALIGWGLFSAGAWVVDGFKRDVAEADRMIAANEARQAAAVAEGPSDAVVQAGAMTTIKDRAVDPASVRFRNVAVIRQANGAKAVCGEFNARNRAGGYNGYERFISAGVGGHTWVESDAADFGAAWASLCRG